MQKFVQTSEKTIGHLKIDATDTAIQIKLHDE